MRKSARETAQNSIIPDWAAINAKRAGDNTRDPICYWQYWNKIDLDLAPERDLLAAARILRVLKPEEAIVLMKKKMSPNDRNMTCQRLWQAIIKQRQRKGFEMVFPPDSDASSLYPEEMEWKKVREADDDDLFGGDFAQSAVAMKKQAQDDFPLTPQGKTARFRHFGQPTEETTRTVERERETKTKSRLPVPTTGLKRFSFGIWDKLSPVRMVKRRSRASAAASSPSPDLDDTLLRGVTKGDESMKRETTKPVATPSEGVRAMTAKPASPNERRVADAAAAALVMPGRFSVFKHLQQKTPVQPAQASKPKETTAQVSAQSNAKVSARASVKTSAQPSAQTSAQANAQRSSQTNASGKAIVTGGGYGGDSDSNSSDDQKRPAVVSSAAASAAKAREKRLANMDMDVPAIPVGIHGASDEAWRRLQFKEMQMRMRKIKLQMFNEARSAAEGTNIVPFNGDSHAFREWWRRISVFCDDHPEIEEDTLKKLLLRTWIKGRVIQRARDSGWDDLPFEEIVAAIGRDFHGTANPENIMEKIKNFRVESSHSAKEVSVNFRTLIAKYYDEAKYAEILRDTRQLNLLLNDTQLKTYLTDKLPARMKTYLLRKEKCKTLDDCLEGLMDMHQEQVESGLWVPRRDESFSGGNRQRGPPFQNRRREFGPRRDSGARRDYGAKRDFGARRNNFGDRRSKSDRKERMPLTKDGKSLCFACQTYPADGHMARDCPTKQRDGDKSKSDGDRPQRDSGRPQRRRDDYRQRRNFRDNRGSQRKATNLVGRRVEPTHQRGNGDVVNSKRLCLPLLKNKLPMIEQSSEDEGKESSDEPIRLTIHVKQGDTDGFCNALCDHGSHITLVRPEVITKLGLEVTEGPKKIFYQANQPLRLRKYIEVSIAPVRNNDLQAAREAKGRTTMRAYIVDGLSVPWLLGRVEMRKLGINPPTWRDGTRIVEADMQTYALPRYPGDDYFYKHLDYGYPLDEKVDTNTCTECHKDCDREPLEAQQLPQPQASEQRSTAQRSETVISSEPPLVRDLKDMKKWTQWFYASKCCRHCLHPTSHHPKCKLHDDAETEDCRSRSAKKALLRNCFRMAPAKRVRFYINWFNKYGMKHGLRERPEESKAIEVIQPNEGGTITLAQTTHGAKAMTLLPEEEAVAMHLAQTKHGCLVLTNEPLVTSTQSKDSNAIEYKYGRGLPKHKESAFANLITRYSDVYAADSFHIGRLPENVERIEFKLKKGAKMPRARAYRLNSEGRKEVESQVRKLLDAKLITTSNSPYASPCFVVAKPDGSWRFVIAYMQLNAAHESDTFPLPRIEKLIESTAGKRIFSAIDLKSAYWHLSIPEDQRKYTAFVTESGLYEWTVLPFGLKNAPSIFQRVMHKIFGDLEHSVLFYLDDILVHTVTVQEHLNTLETVLERIRKYGLRIGLPKCNFFQTRLKFLGLEIDGYTVKACAQYVSKVLKLKEPTNKKELGSLMGAIQYIGAFIPGLQQLAWPLNKLRSGGMKWQWQEEQKEAFRKLKNAVEHTQVLALPDPRKRFVLATDASDYAIGGVLMQPSREEKMELDEPTSAKLKPIQFLSKTLGVSQRNWTIAEKELWAIIWCINRWREHLLGNRFVVLTDHKNLELLNTNKNMTQRFERWRLALQEFDFRVQYVPGFSNTLADYCSREMAQLSLEAMKLEVTDERKAILVIGEVPAEFADGKPHIMTRGAKKRWKEWCELKRREEEELNSDEKENAQSMEIEEIKEDESNEIGKIIDSGVVSKGTLKHLQLIERAFAALAMPQRGRALSKDIFHQFQNVDTEVIAVRFYLEAPAEKKKETRQRLSKWFQRAVDRNEVKTDSDHLLLVRERRYVPLLLRKRILQFYHESNLSQHAGETRMTTNLERNAIWPGMHRDISEWVRTCSACQHAKGRKRSEFLKGRNQIPSRRFEVIAIDLVGPLPEDKLHNRYVLTVQCQFSRFVKAIPLQTMAAIPVALALLNEWCFAFGLPSCILSDNGTQFTGAVFSHLRAALGMHYVFSAVFHPETNGRLERWHSYLKSRLRTLAIERNLNYFKGDTWSVLLPAICCAYNCQQHPATGFTPYELVFAYPAILPWTNHPPKAEGRQLVPRAQRRDYESFVQMMRLQCEEIWTKAYRLELEWRESHVPPALKKTHRLKRGDQVLLFEADQRRFNIAKLKEWFTGPYAVKSVKGGRVTIEKKGRTREVQENRLKKYYTRVVEAHSMRLPRDLRMRAEKLKSVLRNLKHSGRSMYEANVKRVKLSTPPILAKKMASIVMELTNSNSVIELMANSGEITQYLPNGAVAIEEDAARVEEGKQRAKNAVWKQWSVLDEEMAEFAVNEKFEVCVADPKYDLALAAIALGKELTLEACGEDDESGVLIYLLPTAFFRSVHNWHQLGAMKMVILCEYRVGQWIYYPDGDTKKKSTDSIFVIAHERDHRQQTPWTTVEFDTTSARDNDDEGSSERSSRRSSDNDNPRVEDLS